MPERIGIIAAEPVSPVVAHPPRLGLAREQLQRAAIRRDPEIPPTDVHRGRKLRRRQPAAAVAIRQIQPAVEPPLQAVGEVLGISDRQPGKHHRAAVRPTVAVGVFEEKNFGHGHHQHAVAPGPHRIRITQAVGKKRRPVVDAVAARRFEHAHPAAGFPFAILAQRIVPHLHHPHPAVGPPAHIDGIHDQRLRHGEFHLEARGHTDGRERFGGRLRTGQGDFFRRRNLLVGEGRGRRAQKQRHHTRTQLGFHGTVLSIRPPAGTEKVGDICPRPGGTAPTPLRKTSPRSTRTPA